MENKKNIKPLPYVLFIVIGSILLIIGVIILISIVGSTDSFLSGNVSMSSISLRGILSFILIGGGISLLSIGLKPLMAKYHIKTTNYVQKSNAEELEEISSDATNIHSKAITNITKSIKTGLKDTKFCKFCGAEIDKDSSFCNKCGKKID